MVSLHQEMGYDRAITLFSPDGRLYQVEYAKKTVENGNDSIGFVCKDGVLLISNKKSTNPLMVMKSVEKSYVVDDHIISVSSGLLSDARILIDKARLYAQENRIKFQSEIDILSLVKYISDIKQYSTQAGGLRPYGVSFLFAGRDMNGKKLFMTDPAGIYFEFKAAAIGKNEKEINEKLVDVYKEDMSMRDAVLASLNLLKETQKDDFSVENLDVIVLKDEDKKAKFLSGKDVLDEFDINENK